MTGAPEERDAFGPFVARRAEAGIFSDFDGTLSDIVDNPEQARPVAGVTDVLARLAERFGRVGVISGRPVSFLRDHLGVSDDLRLAGLYGMQTLQGGIVSDHEEAAGWRPVIERVRKEAAAALAEGIGLEDKGLTLTLHFRSAPGRGPEVQRWAESAAARHGLRLVPGRRAYELRPAVRLDKGTALMEQAEGLAAVCFIGDDSGDLDAFDTLDRLAEGGTSTLRVGVKNDEAPDELVDRADLVVGGPSEVVAVLERLAAATEGR